MSDFFTEQFHGDVKQGISAFTGEPRPLKDPITESEVQHAISLTTELAEVMNCQANC